MTDRLILCLWGFPIQLSYSSSAAFTTIVASVYLYTSVPTPCSLNFSSNLRLVVHPHCDRGFLSIQEHQFLNPTLYTNKLSFSSVPCPKYKWGTTYTCTSLLHSVRPEKTTPETPQRSMGISGKRQDSAAIC